MGRVSGRACIVTGAAQGIGKAIGLALLDEGAEVCFADRNAEKLDAIADRDRAITATVDVSDRSQPVGSLVSALPNGTGRRQKIPNDAFDVLAGRPVGAFGGSAWNSVKSFFRGDFHGQGLKRIASEEWR